MLSKYRKINSLEDGNCAFNAFVLGVCDLILGELLSDKNKDYELLYGVLEEKLKIEPTWDAFKSYIVSNQTYPTELQKNLALVFRELSSLLKQSLLAEVEVFQAEFRDHLFRELNIPRPETGFRGGDIYSQHVFMNQKFEEVTLKITEAVSSNEKFDFDNLRAAYIKLDASPEKVLSEMESKTYETFQEELEKQTQFLASWFHKGGYNQFIEQMKLQGKWAGDLELRPLFEYLEIDGSAIKKDFCHHIYSNHGFLNQQDFTLTQINLLIERGIINNDIKQGKLMLLDMTEEKLEERLKDVEGHEKITQAWKINNNKLELTDVDAEELYNKLIKRGIIKKIKDEYFFFSDLTSERLQAKLGEIKDYQNIVEKWRQSYHNNPQIALMLKDSSAAHWYYLQPIEYRQWDLSRYEILVQIEHPLKVLFSEAAVLTSIWNAGFRTNGLEYLLNKSGKGQEDNNDHSSGDPDEFVPISLPESYEDESPYPSAFTSIPQRPPIPLTVKEIDSPNDAEEDELNDVENELNRYPGQFYGKHPLFQRSDSPPHKKGRHQEINTLKTLATTVLGKLKDLSSKNHLIIKGLIEGFADSSLSGEVAPTHSFILVNPEAYAKVKDINEPFELPPELNEFTNKYLCEILSQACNHLKEPVMEYYIWLIARYKETTQPNEPGVIAAKFFLKMYDFLCGQNANENKKFKKLAKEFDIKEVDFLEQRLKLLPTDDIRKSLKEIRELILIFINIVNCIDSKRCAQSFALMLSKEEHPSLHKLFTSLAQKDIEEVNEEERKILLNLKTVNFENKAAANGINCFLKLFAEEIKSEEIKSLEKRPSLQLR